MRKLILTAFAAAGLAASGLVFAQAGDEQNQTNPRPPQNPANITPYGPIPGTPEYYGNSGWRPDIIFGPNVYPENYRGYPPAAAVLPRSVDRNRDGIVDRRELDRRDLERRDWERREAERARLAERRDRDRDGVRDGRDRDRDGDGVNNRRDRFPDDSRRQ